LGEGGRSDKTEPLAPKPSRATLTLRKAKWYHWATEKMRVSAICRINVAAEMRPMAIYLHNIRLSLVAMRYLGRYS